MKNQLGRIALSGILATGLTLGSAAAFAQQDSPAPPDAAAQQGGHRQPPTPDEQVARMTKRYNLSADQQTQIKPIIADAQQKMMALRGDSSLSRDDKMAKMKSIHEDSNTKIQAILTILRRRNSRRINRRCRNV